MSQNPKIANWLVLILGISLLTSCGLYNRNVMFQTKKGIISDTILDAISRAEKNYIVRKNDYIDLKVYTNKGEQIVDPTGQMMLNTQNTQMQPGGQIRYLVETNGFAKFPLIGRISVEGLKLSQLDSLLEKKYSAFYKEAYIVTSVLNKRVIVLGASGGLAGISGTIVPLNNENMNLIEVLALTGGLDAQTRVNNIRIIRGDLRNPNVYLVDLSTIEGVKQANLLIQPNDIIYIERYNRLLLQTISSLSPVFSFVSTLTTLVILIISFRNR
ncbi:MAG: polysaccharide biosynthesis/export family protein [Cytophagales bacterium]|nr:polysaccharide biosynthesis/export family protein [Cytophagales bacterium]